jgi:hypothetical protein
MDFGEIFSNTIHLLGNHASFCKMHPMSEGKFTPQAAILWSPIPMKARKQILANVFCAKCLNSVQIKDFIGEEKHGDIYLKGFCVKCGGAVVRVVESSERDSSRN